MLLAGCCVYGRVMRGGACEICEPVTQAHGGYFVKKNAQWNVGLLSTVGGLGNIGHCHQLAPYAISRSYSWHTERRNIVASPKPKEFQ